MTNPQTNTNTDASADAAQDDDFDPTSVPVFPVIAVEITSAEADTVAVAGDTFPVSAGDDVFDVAAELAAQHIRRRGLTHARVAARVGDERWMLIIGADGTRHELPTPTRRSFTARPGTARTGRSALRRPGNARRNARRRRIAIAGTVFGLLCALVITALIALITATTHRDAAPVAGPQAPPPTELPVLPPDGATTHADWSVPVSRSAETPGGQTGGRLVVDNNANLVVLTGTTRRSDTRLTGLDPATGVQRWSSAIPGNPTDGPYLTRIDGQDVIAVLTSTTLAWWPATGADQPLHTEPIAPNEKVTFAGATPLITMPDQQARIPSVNGAQHRTIPAGATAIRADNTAIRAMDPQGQIWTLDNDDPHVPDPASTAAAPSPGATATVIGTTAELILLSWAPDPKTAPTATPAASTSSPGTTASPRAGRILSLTDLDGRQLATLPAVGTPDPNTWTAGDSWAVGAGALVDLSRSTLTAITNNATWRTRAIIGNQIYGAANGQAAALRSDGTTAAQRYPNAATPIFVTDSHTYVTATSSGGQAHLYALTRV